MIRIVIDGIPEPAGRPRFARMGKFVKTYTPAETQKYQSHMRKLAQDAMAGQNPLTGALSVAIRIVLPIPTSLSKKRTDLALVGALRPTSRPDLDNYIKQLDAFNGLVWRDDSQIVSITADKRYGLKPTFEIIIDEIATASHDSREQPMLFQEKKEPAGF